MSSSEAFSSTSAMLASAERICQFYLRGRCQRENCDFKHDPEKLKAAKAELAAAKGAAEKDNKAEGAPVVPAPPVIAFKSPAPNAPGKNNAPPSVMSGGCDKKTLPYNYFVHTCITKKEEGNVLQKPRRQRFKGTFMNALNVFSNIFQ